MRGIDWLGVTALLLFAAGLRIIGLSYGQLNPEYFPSYAPYGMVHEQLPVNPDSFQNVAIPVEMALKNRRNPEFFTYPSFIINLNYVMNGLTGALDGLSLSDRQGLTLLNYAPFSLYVFSRVYSVFGGLLMVACAYAVSRLVCGRKAALFAGLIVASSYTLVTHAHYAKPNTLATGWMMLALWSGVAALYARQSRSRETLYILSGIATGLAASTYYNGIAVALIIAPIGLILYLRHRSRRIIVGNRGGTSGDPGLLLLDIALYPARLWTLLARFLKHRLAIQERGFPVQLLHSFAVGRADLSARIRRHFFARHSRRALRCPIARDSLALPSDANTSFNRTRPRSSSA